MSLMDQRITPSDVLPPFNTRAAGRHSRAFWIGMGLFIFFCLFYGAAFAVLAPYVMVPFFLPPAALLLLAVWALPETGRPPTRLLDRLTYAFFICLVMWPAYLAIVLPGLPWLTMIRLTGFPLALTFLICLAVSQGFRRDLRDALSAAPLIWRLVVAFAVLAFVSIGFSDMPMFSMQKFITAQVTWTCIFFIGCYFFLKEGRVEKFAVMLWIMAIILGFLGVWEYHLRHVVWINDIPSFLKIEDPSVERALAGSMRDFTNRYRVQGTYSTALGMSEFTSLVLPFVLYFVTGPYRMRTRLAAGASAVFLVVLAALTGSRSGMIGVLLALLIHAFVVAARTWRTRKESIFGPLVTLGYPAIFGAVVAAVFAIGRLRALVIGDGSQDPSNQARVDQYTSGIPLVLKQPWGYGIGRGGETLGYAPFGFVTIDTYYLMILLDYGVIGFLIFYSLLLTAVFRAGWTAYRSDVKGKDFGFLAPVASALFIFFVIKSIFSEQDNNPLIFMMLGMVVALLHRVRRAKEAQA